MKTSASCSIFMLIRCRNKLNGALTSDPRRRLRRGKDEMKRSRIALLTLFVALAMAIPLRAQTPAQQFERADAELNRVYGELRGALTDAQKEQLKQSQRQWISERDSFASSGMSRNQQLEILTSRTIERIAALQKALSSLHTPQGDNSQLSAEFQAADEELNRVYRQLRDLSSEAEKAKLKEGQRRWIEAKESSATGLTDPQQKNALLLR